MKIVVPRVLIDDLSYFLFSVTSKKKRAKNDIYA